MKRINGFDVYTLTCGSCGEVLEGRLFHPALWLGSAKYCSKCNNLKLLNPQEDPTGDSGPKRCSCGGSYSSVFPVCPACGSSIANVEKQLAAQFYLVQPAEDEDHPTVEEIDAWYSDKLREGFCTGESLFIQLGLVIAFDDDTGTWLSYGRFEF